MQQAKTMEAAWIAVWLGLAGTGSVLAHTFLETEVDEYLYISANYARQAGDTPASDQYLRALNEEIARAREDLEGQPEELEGQEEYLLEAASKTVLITPGGRLEPDLD